MTEFVKGIKVDHFTFARSTETGYQFKLPTKYEPLGQIVRGPGVQSVEDAYRQARFYWIDRLEFTIANRQWNFYKGDKAEFVNALKLLKGGFDFSNKAIMSPLLETMELAA